MKRNRIVLLFSIAVFAFSSCLFAQNKIAAFGSSVCNGTGDETSLGGYIGRFKTMMANYGWDVVNVSRGGDNTIKIQDRWQKGENPSSRTVKEEQYLLPQKPNYVIIGLSLTNEGIKKDAKAKQDSVLEQFRTGLLGIIDRCSKEGFKAVIANCYPNTSFTKEHYEATKRMNAIINSWNVPSINLLGSVDDGNGHWVEGFYRDDLHPSSGGHRELYFSIVPTLFQALATGKKHPSYLNSNRYLFVNSNSEPALAFTPIDTIHSFTVSFKIRNPKNITALKIGGKTAKLITTEYLYKDQTRKNISIFSSADTMNTSLKIEEGKVVYSKSDGNVISEDLVFDRDKWYDVTLSFSACKGETAVYVNDKLLIKTGERIIPQRFKIGLRGEANFKDILLYRSSLNEDEIKSMVEGTFIQSSLEIYSPLSDPEFLLNKSVENLAQSTASFLVKSSNAKSLSIQK